MNNTKIAFILILVLATAWAASKNAGSEPGKGFFGNTPSSDNTSKDSNDIGRDLRAAEKEAKRIKEEIEKNKIAKESSPLSANISLSASSAQSTDPQSEYLTFDLSPNHQGKVLITGLRIQSTVTGKGTNIPEGVQLSFSGQVNNEDPIFISPGDRVILVTGRSPTGYSFKLNKCTGYFNQFQKFTPSLPKNCPRPEDEAAPLPPNNFSDACIDFLESIPRCTTVLKNIPVAYLESQCQSYITQKINYTTCVDLHKNDPDFYKNEWRVYLGRNEELWKSQREIIKLLDLNGKTIDTVTY